MEQAEILRMSYDCGKKPQNYCFDFHPRARIIAVEADWDGICLLRGLFAMGLGDLVRALETKMKIRRCSRRSWGRPAAAALLLSGAVVVSGARADTIVSDLGVAGPNNYAILGLNSGVTITLNGPGQTVGNVGGFGDVALNSSTPPAITGNLFLGTAGTTAGSAGNLSAQVSGSIIQTAASNTQLVNAAAAATSAANTFKTMAADQTISTSITSTTTLTATHSGFYVVNLNGNITLGNTDKLILSEAAGVNAQFVLNVNGNITLNGGNNFSGGDIVLGGGLTLNNVLINVTSTTGGDNVTSSGGSSPDPAHPGNTLPNAYIQGILLDVGGGIHLSPGQVYGEIIGGGNEINLVSGSQVNSQTAAPLPSTALSGTALLGVVGAGLTLRRRRSMA